MKAHRHLPRSHSYTHEQSIDTRSSLVPSTSASSLPGLQAQRPTSSGGRRVRADPNRTWRQPHEVASLPLPPLAKGMSRHRCPLGTKPRQPSHVVSIPQPKQEDAARIQRMHVLGRDAMGAKSWWRAVFDAVDGTGNAFLTPAEFAALADRMKNELGHVEGFKINFNDVDADFDGRLSLQEWEAYAKGMEKDLSRPRCQMAAWRVLGRRLAAPRKRMQNLMLSENYNKDSSLQLLTVCSKPWSDNLFDLVCKALEHQADPNASLAGVSYNGYTPLIFLAMANSTVRGEPIAACIKALIEAKADVHLESESSGSLGKLLPLRVAAQMQNRHALAALLEYIDVGDRFQWAAGEYVEYVMLEELRTVCIPQILNKTKSKYSAQATNLLIMFASPLVSNKLGHSGARKLLNGEYEDGGMRGLCADPNGKGIDGTTALMELVKEGNVETVRALLQGRASPLQQDSEGATPLHFAASALHLDIVKALLAAEANPSLTDHAGFSAWMLVGEEKYTKATDNVGEEFLIKDSLAREQILKLLRPKWDAEEVIEQLAEDWTVLVANGAEEDYLTSKLRLHESLFFDPLAIARNTCEGRAPRLMLLDRCGTMIMELLKVDPLKGKQKKLTKYLLLASMGPVYNLSSKHLKVPWSCENNRSTYDTELRSLVTGLLDMFAADCDKFRDFIEKDAEANPDGICAALRSLPADVVEVPEDWQHDEFWKVVQERQLLRYDPEWARGIHDGASCCLALLKLGSVEDLSDYSARLQVHHRPMEELLAEGYVKYSDLCNKRFQDLMQSVAKKVVNEHGLDVTFPLDYVGVKRLKRLSEKTREARDERGSLPWPERSKEYLAFSHCFYILDTVRLSFVCNGQTLQDEVACCMKLFEAFQTCSVEKDGVQMLRQKSGFAYGVRGSGGYADVKMLIYADLGVDRSPFDDSEIPLKIIGEVQLILHCYMTVKERMHLAYEVNRGSFDRNVQSAPSLDAT